MAKTKQLWLSEDITHGTAPYQVDRDKGVIRGVKVIGLVSANGRRYTLEALSKAMPLYQGVSVNINHPRRPDDPRQADDRFGRLTNVRLGSDGLYADLEYLKSHPLAERICEAAERMPELFGLSHNAQGAGETDDNGIFVVTEIIEVRSVDLVAEPATTNGLYEGRHRRGQQSMTIKEWLTKLSKTLLAPRQKVLKAVLEGEYQLEQDMPAGSGEPDTDNPDEALKQGFRAAIVAIIDAEDMDPAAKVKKIGQLIKTHAKLTAKDDEPAEEEETEEEEDDAQDDDKGDEQESCKEEEDRNKLAERLRQLERKDKARDLCEAAGFTPDREFLEALLDTTSDKAMKTLVEREKKHRAETAKPGKKTTKAGNTGKQGEQQVEDTVEARMASLRS